MHIHHLPAEILTLIFLLTESRDLLQCALVCKHWTGLALDIKWKYHAVGLADLLHVLEPNQNVYHIEETPTYPGWPLVNDLRSKTWRLKIKTPHDLSHFIYIEELSLSVETPLFPELRALQFPNQYHPAYDFLAGTTLKQLVVNLLPVRIHSSWGISTVTLDGIASRSPHIEEITILSSEFPVDFGVFSQLRKLYNGGFFSVTSWTLLCAGCPLLEWLCLWPMNDVRVSPEQDVYIESLRTSLVMGPKPATQTLPVLRYLDIHGVWHESFLLYVFITTRMPELRELNADFTHLPSEEGHALVSILLERSEKLMKLKFNNEDFNWAALAPFSQLHDLELLGTIDTFTEETLVPVVKSLPNILRLVIDSKTWRIGRSKPALNRTILTIIAEKCQSIRELKIPLNARLPLCEDEEPTSSVGFRRLGLLTLDPLHIDPNTMQQFAKWLAGLCPSLHRLKTDVFHWDSTPRHGLGARNHTEEEMEQKDEVMNYFYEEQETLREESTSLGSSD
ncbi:hypothetical protein FRB90_009284 [Tulasnella sp. 427]|nr:hypothetical protein FRB90_009284 [Tulasnella sp. 427]